MADFVNHDSILRTIWGDSDTILLVFAGSAAEFALNNAVDWLFFTGKVPEDPINRLFSTARFAQDIGFADEQTARQTMDRINRIHTSLEGQRGKDIPAWSHRDVLYMLIDYSERAFTLLHRPLTATEQEELYQGFHQIGQGLNIPDLPDSYTTWQIDREQHLQHDLSFSDYTAVLYAQYRRHLGPWRYNLLLQVQALLVPEHVQKLLKLAPRPPLRYLLWTYPITSRLGLRPFIQWLLMPPRYLADVRRLDRPVRA